jgi:preprotein translocase subunit SecG
MEIFISVIILLVSIFLILVVLVQNPKGGLAANFASSNQVMGVRKTADFLEKATWTLGIALVVLSIVSAAVHPNNDNPNQNQQGEESAIQKQIDEAENPIQAPPSMPDGVPTPDQQNPAQ